MGSAQGKPSALADGPPMRLVSTLPSPGCLQLTLSAKELIGDGRCGRVFATSLSHLCDSSDITVNSALLPELVIKVASRDHVANLAKEASMYQEIESLQGIAIPRFYG
ncbi:hypothetical protein B0H34DRAFT_91282 [Crassisporium funariophilum]|nr:hypothetical protein B0H34DRAFT_91282 [Crassisporium funariophilum]